MPFFRPGRALSHLLRHSDPFSSPAVFSRSPFPSPLTRLFDDVVSQRCLAAPIYTVYGVRDDKGGDQQRKDSHSSASTPAQVQDSRRDTRLERWGARRRHHHHHPLSLFDAFAPFTSTFPSIFSPHSAFAPFARSLGAMPDIAIDMFSTASAYSIHATVPGLDKRDIKITVEDAVLRIEAERKEEKRDRRPTNSSQQPSQPGQDSASGDSSATQAASSSDSAAVKSGEPESGNDSVDYHHVESFYGKVERAIALPDDADAEHLTARYENGVIKIEIPRLAEHKKEPKRVEIQ